MSEKNAEYVDSIQGRLASLKASWQEFSQDVLNSNLIKTLVKNVARLVEFLDKSVTFLGGIPARASLAAAAFLLLSKGIEKFKNLKIAETIDKITKKLSEYTKGSKEAAAATKALEKAENSKQEVQENADSGEAKSGAAVGTIIAVIFVLKELIGLIEKGWDRTYSSAIESMQKSEESIAKTEEELASLQALQEKLREAKGDKSALADIYAELNEKIGISMSLIDGEANAYSVANSKLEDQIKLKKELIDLEKEGEAAEARTALGESRPPWYFLGIKSKNTYSDAVPMQKAYIEQEQREQRGEDESTSFGQSTKSRLKWLGTNKAEWDAYWSAQADLAVTAYRTELEKYEGDLDLTGLFKEAVRTGNIDATNEQEVASFIDVITNKTFSLSTAYDAFYNAVEEGGDVSAPYKDLYDIVTKLEAEYPGLTNELKRFLGVIKDRSESGGESIFKAFYDPISTSSFLDMYQEPFDLLISSLEEIVEYGDLSADTIKKLLDSGIDLPDEFGETAESCTLAADALDRYVEKLLNEAIAAVAAAKSTDELNIARENANRLITTLTILNKTYERSNRKKAIDAEKDALKAQKKALEDEKDVLEDQKDALDEQLDAYKELIDYRKELIESYQKEVEYQRELERKQQNLAKLQARLSAAQLDTSAAGRGRARDIQEQVAEAQQELDDYTLEHAVDILVDQLDDQYSEYENFINEELDAIDSQTQALDDRGKSIEDAISNLDTTPEVYVDTTSISEMLAQASEELNRTYAETNAHLTQIEANTAPTNSHAYSPGLKAYSTSSPYSLPGSTPLIDTKYSTTTIPSQGNKIMTRSEFNKNTPMQRMYGTYENYVKAMHKLGIYHSGGTVGGDEYLKNNEEFAKLMKGEYVSTPKQMETFLSKTLPTMANSIKSGNEFNAPLVSVSCENVTQDSLPGLREIIDEAVEKVQKKLVDGFNRTGFKSPINKKLAT